MTKWTEELTQQLRNSAGDETEEVSRETVATIAEDLGISPRSVAAKLRKEGFVVEKAGAAPSSYTEEETAELERLVLENSGRMTYAELAEALGTGHTARSLQGKILSMELHEHVAPTPPKEVEHKYTEEETDIVIEMANNGAFLEEIAEAVGKPVNSVRGKTLSLLKSRMIDSLPRQRDRKPTTVDAFESLGDRISTMTVEELVEATGKTTRGVKTVLTRRGIKAADYDGAARREKASAASA